MFSSIASVFIDSVHRLDPFLSRLNPFHPAVPSVLYYWSVLIHPSVQSIHSLDPNGFCWSISVLIHWCLIYLDQFQSSAFDSLWFNRSILIRSNPFEFSKSILDPNGFYWSISVLIHWCLIYLDRFQSSAFDSLWFNWSILIRSNPFEFS